MAEKRYLIRGRVQGVGFRWWARSRARELGITGSVRNADDGSVEVLARGSPEQLAALRALLRDGPSTAAVTAVDESDAYGVPDVSFEIAH
jgi:acylphosphatase